MPECVFLMGSKSYLWQDERGSQESQRGYRKNQNYDRMFQTRFIEFTEIMTRSESIFWSQLIALLLVSELLNS